MSTKPTVSGPTIQPYEEPTDELRQVAVPRRGLMPSYVKVQRKWRVYGEIDGEGFIAVWSQSQPGGMGHKRLVKEEWRDLPMVTEEEANQ